MVKVKINTEAELYLVCQELLHITLNLRKFTKLWEEKYGVEIKARKKYWEDKADSLLQRLQIPEHRTQSQIKIEINGDERTTEQVH